MISRICRQFTKQSAKPGTLGALVLVLIIALAVKAVAAEAVVTAGDGVDTAASRYAELIVGGRAVRVYAPSSSAPTPSPLLLSLHGYSSGAGAHERYLRFRALAERDGFVYALPEGTRNRAGRRGWNAGDAFGNAYGHDADDAAHLVTVIRALFEHYPIDRDRVAVFGYSNGGRMTYRLGCDRSRLVAAIAVLAGAQLSDPTARCAPGRALRVLQIHGTRDSVVAYGGGRFAGRPPPGAAAALARWAAYGGCGRADGARNALDLSRVLPGRDTHRLYYRDCRPGGAAELWTIDGAGHTPKLLADGASTRLAAQIARWLTLSPVKTR